MIYILSISVFIIITILIMDYLNKVYIPKTLKKIKSFAYSDGIKKKCDELLIEFEYTGGVNYKKLSNLMDWYSEEKDVSNSLYKLEEDFRSNIVLEGVENIFNRKGYFY